MKAAIYNHLPAWCKYHMPLGVRHWLAPGTERIWALRHGVRSNLALYHCPLLSDKNFIYFFQEHILGYVTASQTNPAGIDSIATDADGWRVGHLQPLHHWIPTAKWSRNAVTLLLGTNSMVPSQHQLKLAQLTHAGDLDNVMRQQATLKFDGALMVNETRVVSNSPSSSAATPSDAVEASHWTATPISLGLRPSWWHSLLARLGCATAAPPLTSALRKELIARVMDSAEQRTLVSEHYLSVRLRNEWMHFGAPLVCFLSLKILKHM
jgi:hypothetical protein